MEMLAKVGQSWAPSNKFTALACVSTNDCNLNVSSIGIATNLYKLIKSLPDKGKSKQRECQHACFARLIFVLWQSLYISSVPIYSNRH
jgi:hypothetical protein